MSDALPLPPRPDIGQYRTLARDLQRACHGGHDAIHDWARRWVDTLTRLCGAERLERASVDGITGRIEARLASRPRRAATDSCRLTDAQYFVALEHGFASWPKFVHHLGALNDAQSEIARFEAATDAIIAGDTRRLAALLRDHPELARARSTREHRSTLLHYVSANGVEDFRQRTPANIVELARLLIAAGADVNAESEAYGGGSTALGLTATSIHPEEAGVQPALLQALLAAGLTIRGCLANGQGDAARLFAARGLPMDLEEAAGVGDLAAVRGYVDPDGSLRNGATRAQLESGFLYACGYGHVDTATFLLDAGVDPAVSNDAGQTALHWTAYGPHVEVARLLLARGARPDVQDHQGATPLDWARRMLTFRSQPGVRERAEELVRLLEERDT
jgi:ankyrin repeat protein